MSRFMFLYTIPDVICHSSVPAQRSGWGGWSQQWRTSRLMAGAGRKLSRMALWPVLVNRQGKQLAFLNGVGASAWETNTERSFKRAQLATLAALVEEKLKLFE